MKSEMDKEYKEATSHKTSDVNDVWEIECSRISLFEPVRCFVEAPQAQSKDSAEQYDLKAQQVMALWTARLGWVGIAGLFASIVGICFVYATLITTRTIGENENKAYVFAVRSRVFLQRPSKFWGTMDHFVVIEALNVGQTPAKNINGFARFYINDSRTPDATLELDVTDYANVIAPGEPANLRYFLPRETFGEPIIKPNESSEFIRLLERDDINKVRWSGVVFYSDVFGKRYRTEFEFEMVGWPFEGEHIAVASQKRLEMFQRVTGWRRG